MSGGLGHVEALVSAGWNPDHALIPATGILWFEHFAGPGSQEGFWDPDDWSNRDDFLIVAGTYFSATGLLGTLSAKFSWRTEFDVAALFLLKLNAQSVRATDLLARSGMYFDAFGLLRTVAARTNLLILCALEPRLFDRWMREPKLPEFREREVQAELKRNGLRVMGHVYDLTSELVHGHFQALGEAGYFQHGWFPRVPAVQNRIYVTGKFLLGAMAWSILSILIADSGDTLPEEVARQKELQEHLHGDLLVQKRIDHLFAVIAEDRHWIKQGKDKWDAGGAFSWDAMKESILKCRRSAQPKRVSARYRRLYSVD